MTVKDVLNRNYFTDQDISEHPYGYLAQIQALGPVVQLGFDDVLIVTGFEECNEVLRNDRDFSSYNSSVGAGYALPFNPEGDDISLLMDAHRSQMPHGDLLVNMDGERHARLRSIMNPLFTPKRLQENEQFVQQLAAQTVRDVVTRGRCEIVREVATPFVTLVVADLLGVPADDMQKFRDVIDASPRPGSTTEDSNTEEFVGPLEFMARYFAGYIQERRSAPRDDVLTTLSQTTYPDGTLPDLVDLVTLAGTIFGAGQDTSAKLLGTAVRYLAEKEDIQDQLRADPTLIPAFIEEVLRLEGSTKATFRLARRHSRIGTVDVPAGKRIIVALAAANRDPRRWEYPDEFRLDRPRARDHFSFGRGVHICAGAPLARTEIRIFLEEFLAQTSHIKLCERNHGGADKPAFSYEPSFFIRGLMSLHVTLESALA